MDSSAQVTQLSSLHSAIAYRHELLCHIVSNIDDAFHGIYVLESHITRPTVRQSACLLASCSVLNYCRVFFQVSCLMISKHRLIRSRHSLSADIDECERGTHVCVNAECNNTVGNYTCSPCFPGFEVGDATTCSKPSCNFAFPRLNPLKICTLSA